MYRKLIIIMEFIQCNQQEATNIFFKYFIYLFLERVEGGEKER